MALQPRKATPSQVPDPLAAFIDGAPDGRPAPAPKAPAGLAKPIKTAGAKAIITVSISPSLLAKLDDWADARGMSRAAAIALAVANLDGLL
jgi:hypothetical protein